MMMTKLPAIKFIKWKSIESMMLKSSNNCRHISQIELMLNTEKLWLFVAENFHCDVVQLCRGICESLAKFIELKILSQFDCIIGISTMCCVMCSNRLDGGDLRLKMRKYECVQILSLLYASDCVWQMFAMCKSKCLPNADRLTIYEFILMLE